MRLFRSLTARLVLTAVALVVLVAVLIGAAATAALHSRLTAQLDDQLTRAARFDGPGGPGGPGPGDVVPNLRSGSLTATLTATLDTGEISGDGPDEGTDLSDAALAQLGDLTPDARIHHLDVSGAGSYRVIAMRLDDETIVVYGLPTRDVDSAVHALLVWEAALTALGALLAGAGGLLLVERQLRPLNAVAATAHEVAALPLASGEIDLSPRVPPELTDERTEVGQVGAALNVLLEHVQSSLEARQRSEQQVRQFAPTPRTSCGRRSRRSPATASWRAAVPTTTRPHRRRWPRCRRSPDG